MARQLKFKRDLVANLSGQSSKLLLFFILKSVPFGLHFESSKISRFTPTKVSLFFFDEVIHSDSV